RPKRQHFALGITGSRCSIQSNPPLAAAAQRRAASILLRLGQYLGIGPAGDVERLGRGGLLLRADPLDLLIPADIDRVQAPLSALLAGTNRLAVEFDEHGVRVRG